jgi:DNA polymerase (family 10)
MVQSEVAGSVRRMQETVGNVDLVAATDKPAAVLGAFCEAPQVLEVVKRTQDDATVLVYGGLEARLHVGEPASWGGALLWHTGSRSHIEHLQALAGPHGWDVTPRGIEEAGTRRLLVGASEEQVYERLGLPWIAPELRENQGEIEAAQAGSLPRLIELQDLLGDLHCHTNWTDGAASLEDMARAARDRGYAYMALTDHSQSLTIARGLTPERLREQRGLVQRINKKLAPFTVLLGTEMDILRDGSLDFSDEVLGSLDYVSASIHSGFSQPRDVMTARILRAIANPLVRTLNHPHGRLLRRREAYAVDMQAVIDEAARLGCALELNAQPERLDLDGTWARRARTAGARFTISSDAHSVRNLDLMRYGIGSARRGWLEAKDVLNTRPLDELRALMQVRRAPD